MPEIIIHRQVGEHDFRLVRKAKPDRVQMMVNGRWLDESEMDAFRACLDLIEDSHHRLTKGA